MSKRRLKYYDVNQHKARVKKLQDGLTAYIRLQENIKAINPKCTSVEELDQYLNESTGFVNTKLSAMALGFEKQYSEVIRLSGLSNEIDSNILTKELDFKTSFLKDIEEQFKIYFTQKETKEIELAESIVDQMNNLPREVKLAIQKNEIQQIFHFSPNSYIIAKQLERI